MPASHAGVADVSSTLGQLSAMVWIDAIIESGVGRVKPASGLKVAAVCRESETAVPTHLEPRRSLRAAAKFAKTELATL